MKKLELTVNVPKERVITLKLPEDVTPGDHRVIVVIEDGVEKCPQALFNPRGLWANQKDVSPEDITRARREMWRKFSDDTEG